MTSRMVADDGEKNRWSGPRSVFIHWVGFCPNNNEYLLVFTALLFVLFLLLHFFIFLGNDETKQEVHLYLILLGL